MKANVKVNIDPKLIARRAPKADHILAIQVQKDTEKFVPASGAPSGLSSRTQVREGKIIYPGPYARYLYNGKVMVDSATGKGPRPITDASGMVFFRFKKGATLRATDRNLVFTKATHEDAQDHWFEASKALNLDKWLRVYRRALSSDN